VGKVIVDILHRVSHYPVVGSYI